MSERSIAPPNIEKRFELEESYRIGKEGVETVGLRLVVDNDKAGEMVVKVRADKSTLFIDEIQIERKYRRKGFGTQLLRHAEDIAKGCRLTRVELRPFATDESSMSTPLLRQWYSKIGYTGTRNSMYKAC
ncbi:MAG: GNAT family N-acetyltransferase [Nitrososphaerales archaeon]